MEVLMKFNLYLFYLVFSGEYDKTIVGILGTSSDFDGLKICDFLFILDKTNINKKILRARIFWC